MKIEHEIFSMKLNGGDLTLPSQTRILQATAAQGWELVQMQVLSDDVWFYCKRTTEAPVEAFAPLVTLATAAPDSAPPAAQKAKKGKPSG